ncbi:putative 4-coumarate--CoA ligase [Lupinus albus]|uniref:Putative 4-coumarate--CoA ligase n=1 Tax=Lupinus albus TaxID=3870 RepID=A0A6A4P5C1_LUPAL|nr:putative 4-coumarate--CoA ligase [Lupinus albus]
MFLSWPSSFTHFPFNTKLDHQFSPLITIFNKQQCNLFTSLATSSSHNLIHREPVAPSPEYITSGKLSNSVKQDRDPDEGSWESMEGLLRCSANFIPLSPISFLERAAKICKDRTSLVYGSLKYNWGQTHHRCLKLASALAQLGISRGDVPPNIEEFHCYRSMRRAKSPK